NKFDLPRSMPDSENFSFSGLKTAVRYLLPKLKGDYLADVCASVQAAIVKVLVSKAIAAAKRHDVALVTVSGGVSGNPNLRKQMAGACKRHLFELKTDEPLLCTCHSQRVAFSSICKVRDVLNL